ncbi:MAG TPA: HlyD family efflux transporter periplasmic adaptor subunit [Longimicrobium sp.]|nr:HlyD family efflux transporter periplasmic adaptor subunit [Longimicrobium sp.]
MTTTERRIPAPPAPLAPLPAPSPANGGHPAPAPGVRKRRLLRQMRWIGALLLVAALVAWALWPHALAVETAAAARGPLRETVDEDGVTRVQERYVVSAPVAGRLLRVGLDEGDAVEPGAVVARIAAAPLDARTAAQARARVDAAAAAVRQADAAVAQAHAELAQARRDARRARTLADAGALSDQAREVAETAAELRARAVAAAEANRRAAAAELASARAAVAGADPRRVAAGTVTEVRSPVRGRVLRVAQQSETMVPAGAPLVELADAHALEIVVDILSADAVRVEPGMPVLIEDWGGAGVLRARVRTVSPHAFTHVSALGVEEQRVNVIADLLTPGARLGEGYRVEARIVTWESPAVLKVPAAALFRRGTGWGVFVAQAGRARLRDVRIGHRGESDAEVLGGVKPGERVILYPSDRVAEGGRVKSE